MIRLLPLLLLACDAPLVDGHYRGEPLAALDLHFIPNGAVPRGALRVAVCWSRDPAATTLGEEASDATRVVRGDLLLRVFDAPEGEAYGRVVLYQDRDGDTRHSAGDPIYGESLDALFTAKAGQVSARARPCTPVESAPALVDIHRSLMVELRPVCD